MKIRFLLHDVYTTTPGGVLTATYNLARQLGTRHDVEIVSALRTADEPLRPLPADVPVRVLSDVRNRRLTWRPRSVVMPRPMAGSSKAYASDLHTPLTDARLARYLWSLHDGAVITMQPHMSVALARLGRASVIKVAQEHRPLTSGSQWRREAARRFYPHLDALVTLTDRDARQYRKMLGVACQRDGTTVLP